MDKENVVYIYNGIILSHKKNETFPLVTTWMDVEVIILNEGSMRKTNIVWFHLNVEPKKQMNKHNQNRLIDRTGGCQRGRGSRKERNRWQRLRGIKFQLQNTWVTGMKSNMGIQSIIM